MKNLRHYLIEAEQWYHNPAIGDNIGIELEDMTLLETYILDLDEQGNLLLDSSDEIYRILESWNMLEDESEKDADNEGDVELDIGYDKDITQDTDDDEKPIVTTPPERQIYTDPKFKHLRPLELDEAEYQGRKVPLGKPMRGDVKKFKVYVKDPGTGNIKKVNFGHGGTSARRAGQKTMKIKKSNPDRRRSFRARHNCDNPGPRTKARYWSCRMW
jgi:hypothetical protein